MFLIFAPLHTNVQPFSDFKEAFAMFDKNGDGEINIKELTSLMRCLGLNPTEGEIVEIMANLDLDGIFSL